MVSSSGCIANDTDLQRDDAFPPRPLIVTGAFLCLAVASPTAGADRAAVSPSAPGHGADSNILFEAVCPLNELPDSGWTPAQQKEIACLLRRIKNDDRLFLSIRVVADPIGARAENDARAMDVARAVAGRLAFRSFGHAVEP